MRNLIIIFGDQLDHESAAFDSFDAKQDAMWMAEVAAQANPEWSHKLRIAFFFSAMRHFRDELKKNKLTVHYTELPADGRKDRGNDFAEVLAADCKKLKPEKLIAVMPGDHSVKQGIEDFAKEAGIELEWREDRHFFCTLDDFAEWADGRKEMVMEMFYRQMRKRKNILMDDDGKPVGGEWNFDKDNRDTFGKAGTDGLPSDPAVKPDQLTREVLDLVAKRFADSPGSLAHWTLPVTRKDAIKYLDGFIKERLPLFGRFEDAMWDSEVRLYHSRLSALLNIKLLNPRECVEKAVKAYHSGDAPINSVEGFVRQLLGWREFIRGVYWLQMPQYIELNALDADLEVPQFLWDGDTEMACVRDCMQSVIDHAYAHHIPRLMVLGQLCLLLGVHPRRFHDWHMAMYLDAIDWVSLPNTLGMSQYGDGGIVGTKPYCASGKYIDRMSPYCKQCKFDPGKATGENACPFTTLYWSFLDRHHSKFKGNRRMAFQVKNLERKSDDDFKAIRKQTKKLLNDWNCQPV